MSTDTKQLFTAPKTRVIIAVFGALLTSVFVTAGMPLYLPFGQTDSIGIPIILFPITWLLLFYFSLLQRRLLIVSGVLLVFSILHIVLIYLSLT